MSEEVYLEMPENIVSTATEDIKAELIQALENDPPALALDLEKTRYVDSMGIGVLIAAFNSCHKKQIEFKLLNVDKEVYELFTTMRLDQHFPIQPKEKG